MTVSRWLLLVALVVSAAGLMGFPGLAVQPAAAQESSASEGLTLERVMADPDWIGNAPEAPRWAPDGSAVYYEQKRVGEETTDLWRIDLGGDAPGEPTRVDDADRGRVPPPSIEWNRERDRAVWAREGDLFLWDAAGGVRPLTRTASGERNPSFLAGGGAISFQRGDSLYVRDLATGLEWQPADLALADDPAEDKDATWLEEQQERLFEWVRDEKRDRERAREVEEERRLADPTLTPPTWYLGDDVSIVFQSLSPSGDHLLLVLTDKNPDQGRQDKMPRWVTESGYVEVDDVRSKVGTRGDGGDRLVLLDLAERQRHDLDLAALPGITEDPLADLRAAAEAAEKGAGEETAGEGDDEAGDGEEAGGEETGNGDAETEENDAAEAPAEPRDVDFWGATWNPNGDRLAVLLRSRDNKDRWIATVDLEDGALEPVHRLHDEAWINWRFNDLGWLPGSGDTLWYLSEEDGYSHLYTATLPAAGDDKNGDDDEGDDGGIVTRRLTAGDFEISEVAPAPDGSSFTVRANREHPGITEVYRVAAEGGPLERLTELGGLADFRLSPDGERLLLTHSTTLRPPDLWLQAARPGADARRLTETVSEEFTAVPWIEPRVVAVPSSHGEAPIYSRLYEPPGWDPATDAPRPAVLFVHGAGYLQNAHQGWSSYFREFMFHSFLVQQGYLVLDMDYRASAGYGRDWRTAIYRRMGEPELEDLIDGVEFLTGERGADPERIGVYGGSYGGFMTFMALFEAPEVFAAGAALRPVTDWAHYNHPYTANILNTPEIDPDAYARSSPIERAEGLEDPLLIIHGMVDDNVFFLDTVRLAQRLIELGKEDWEVAIFPVEPHGFVEPSSWLDAYRRIFKLFERHLGEAPAP